MRSSLVFSLAFYRRLAAIFLISLATGSLAHAEFYQADLPTTNADVKMGTHIIIVGKGMEAGRTWADAGETLALAFKDRARHGNIRVIAAIEDDQTLTDVQDWGYTNVQTSSEDMTGDKIVALIKQVPLIASIDFIGHNGALLGFALENFDNRFFIKEVKALASYKSHFSPDSFIRIMGCNTGWNLAPAFANTLQVPAAGTLTSADVELMYQPGAWLYDEGAHPTQRFTGINPITYARPLKCRGIAGCTRLRPVNTDYSGKHGNYTGNLPFSKYFCGAVPANDCFRRMAKSTQYLVSVSSLAPLPTLAAFSDVVADQFCPSNPNATQREACRQAIVHHLDGSALLPPTFTTNRDDALTCDFKKCQFKVVCDSDPCVMQSSGPHESTTYVNELNAYRAGYDLWANEIN